MSTNLGNLKMSLRIFLDKPVFSGTEVSFTWSPDSGVVDVNCDGRGLSFAFPPKAMNDDGDYMTDDEKQSIADALSAIVDEHNASI